MDRFGTGFAKVLLLGLVLFAGPFSSLSASPPAQEQLPGQKPLRHEVTVALKLIHVYVTDRDHRPVRGLQKGEFILRDDGVIRQVTDFEEHVPAEAAAAAKLVETPLRAPRLPGRKFLFFFDYGFNTGNGIKRSARIALDFLDKRLGPRDQVGVATFSGRHGLRVPLLFTSDLKTVRDLVRRIGAFEQSGRVEEIEDKYQQGLKDGAFADARPESVLTWDLPVGTGFDPEAEQRHLIRVYLDNLLALARALRYETGQKQMVFFSEGAPYRSIWRGDQITADKRGNPPDQFSEIRNLAEDLLKELASSNVTVFTLNTSEPDARPELVRGGTLQKMAQSTGGRYWGNSYVTEAFSDQVQAQTGSYYVLGYPVDEKWDGRYHRIKVEVARPGLTVRTQSGYFSPKAFVECGPEERRIQLIDLALAGTPLHQTPLPFAMAALPIETAAGPGLRIAASIPLREIGEAIGPRTEITALVFNARDEIAAERRLEAEEGRLTGGAATVVADVILPPGEYRCRTVVRNLETGRAAVAGASVQVPGPPATGLRILRPLMLTPMRSPELKLAPPAGKPKAAASAAATAPGPLFDPSQYGPLLGNVLRAGTEVGAEVHVVAARAAAAKVRIEAFFFDRLNQERIPLAVTVMGRRDDPGGAVLFLRLTIPDLEPDVYALILSAVDGASEEKTEIVRDFSIEKAAGAEAGRGEER